MTKLSLAFDLRFEDLYDDLKLASVDVAFLDHVGEVDGGLKARLLAARKAPADLENKATADLLLELSPFVDAFVGKLFGISDALSTLSGRHLDLDVFKGHQIFVPLEVA